MRKVLPVDAYPSFEVETQNGSNQWATTRAQRPRFSFQCTLTVRVDNEKYGHEYICTIATVLAQVMTSPQNLQMRVVNETKWDPSGGLVETFILDSLVDDATYSSAKEGSIRKAQFNWFALIHEPFPASMWALPSAETPTILKPTVVPS